MKANEVARVGKLPLSEEIGVNPVWKDKKSECFHCSTHIKKGYGVLVGGNTYCNYNCYAKKMGVK